MSDISKKTNEIVSVVGAVIAIVRIIKELIGLKKDCDCGNGKGKV
jgi:hypothetical protein